MNGRWTSGWIGCGAMALALGSWMVSNAGADDENAAVPPRVLPASAFLTGEQAPQQAELDGVQVTVRSVEAGYELTLVNPTDRALTLRWQVECSQVRGSLIARMGPIPARVHEEIAELRVPANGRAVHLVRVAHPEPPAAGFGAFASMQIELRSLVAGAPQRAAAMLTIPVEA